MTKDAGIIAAAVNLQGAALTAWFNILDQAIKSQLTSALMDSVLRDNPECASLCAAYVDELAKGALPTPDLPGMTTEDRVNAARAGFDAVNLQSHAIQAELAFGDGLATVTGHIDLLANYKNLHDGLQTFQYGQGSFQTLLNAAHKMGTDLKQVQVLRQFLKKLRLFCQQVAPSVAALPSGLTLRDIEQTWLMELEKAAITLQTAIDSKSTDAYDALFDVRTVLRVVPSRLNQQIFVTAKNLPFGVLATGLDAIIKLLPADDSAIGPIIGARDAILVLSSTIYARVVEHKLWQDVDHKLADLTDMIEPAGDDHGGAADKSLPFQFSPLWRNLELKIRVLADLDPDGLWRIAIATYSTGVNDQLTRETVDTEFILAFEAYRDEAQQRFVQVDLALKKECTSLVRVSEPLHKILEELKP